MLHWIYRCEHEKSRKSAKPLHFVWTRLVTWTSAFLVASIEGSLRNWWQWIPNLALKTAPKMDTHIHTMYLKLRHPRTIFLRINTRGVTELTQPNACNVRGNTWHPPSPHRVRFHPKAHQDNLNDATLTSTTRIQEQKSSGEDASLVNV